MKTDKGKELPQRKYSGLVVGRGLAPIDGNLRGKKEYPYLLKMC